MYAVEKNIQKNAFIAVDCKKIFGFKTAYKINKKNNRDNYHGIKDHYIDRVYNFFLICFTLIFIFVHNFCFFFFNLSYNVGKEYLQLQIYKFYRIKSYIIF